MTWWQWTIGALLTLGGLILTWRKFRQDRPKYRPEWRILPGHPPVLKNYTGEEAVNIQLEPDYVLVTRQFASMHNFDEEALFPSPPNKQICSVVLTWQRNPTTKDETVYSRKLVVPMADRPQRRVEQGGQ